ncbi:MAG: hypothetical protein BGN86_07050 [Caulobacterales bacterium 68-7]|nr:MAG: hypothetical protein BGN86_07050 [Caulobacterales bacterium 68-7]
MPSPPRLKKSENLEIRLPHATKQAFMAHCRAEGRTASDALRAFIDDRLSPAPVPRRRSGLARLAAGVLIATAVGAIAAPSLARPLLQAQVGRMDLDGDGAISLAEFARLDVDHDGKVSLGELSR